jgi:lipopolysaccharide transport system permease protein
MTHSQLYPEDEADHSRPAQAAAMQMITGDNVIVIKPRNHIRRLGLLQVWERRSLLKFFVLRAIRGRYRTTRMGYGWIVFRPLLLCLVYVVVFSHVVGVKTAPTPFPLFVFLGLSLYLFFSGAVSDTAASLPNNAGIMSKVYYPRLIVPLTSLFVNVTDLVVSLAIVAGMMVFYGAVPGFHVIYFPFYLGGFVLASFALGLVLAAHSIKHNDFMMALPVVMRVMVYLMPCVYPISVVSEKWINLYYLNPMVSLIEGIRWSLDQGTAPPLWALGWSVAFTALGLLYGLIAFTRAERTMVDSL